ncbi:MAG: stage III sporulation protein AD [Clostridia bacterium]|nr:stage III sporulation protein AD [Clostridia bacterium]
MSAADVLVTVMGLLLCGAVLSAVLRSQRPELALCLSLLAGVLAIGLLLRRMTPLVTALRRMTALGGVGEGYLGVVLRGAGICLVTQLAADTCRDAGDTALAGKAELTGRILLLLLAVPLYEEILFLIVGVVNGQAVMG